jgi:hypothetical protein
MSSQELARALGATSTRGGAGPSSGATARDFVDAIALRLLGFKRSDLVKDRLQATGKGGEVAQGIACLDLSREQVAQVAQGGEAVARGR